MVKEHTEIDGSDAISDHLLRASELKKFGFPVGGHAGRPVFHAPVIEFRFAPVLQPCCDVVDGFLNRTAVEPGHLRSLGADTPSTRKALGQPPRQSKHVVVWADDQAGAYHRTIWEHDALATRLVGPVALTVLPGSRILIDRLFRPIRIGVTGGDEDVVTDVESVRGLDVPGP